MATRYFKAWGTVQNVMFRQTIIRAAQKRSLEAGASNIKANKNEVFFVLRGDNQKIQEIIDFLKAGKEMNDWKAKVERLEEVEEGPNISTFQVTTTNVDDRHWNPNVTFYL